MRRNNAPLFICLAIAICVGVMACNVTRPRNYRDKLATVNLKGLPYLAHSQPTIEKKMVYVPGGTYALGSDDSVYNGRKKKVTVSSFYMDATEVSNAEYKEFVDWVRDSLAALDLHYYTVSSAGDTAIDWKKTATINYNDKETLSKLTSILLSPEKRLYGKLEIDPAKLIFCAKGFDYASAVLPENREKARSAFLYRVDVPVYPDTLVWVSDFKYAYNVPMTQLYFSHPTYKNYPVVGVSWVQAEAYCSWRTNQLNSYLAAHHKAPEGSFRLPTEAEWEYAAKGGGDSIFYWGTNSLTYTSKNKAAHKQKSYYMANYKPSDGDYNADGSLFPVRIDSYNPNQYGLYNMLGNVAEWTNSYYYDGAYNFQNQFNPNITSPFGKDDTGQKLKKVIKGGSWKDIEHFLNPGARSYEYGNRSNSYTGFRCVINLSGNWGSH